MSNFAKLAKEYAAKPPYDFTTNPVQIKYIAPERLHQEAAGYSDISVHVPLLTFLALQCDNIVEFGCREGESTLAFLSGYPTSLMSVDINDTPLRAKIGKLSNWDFLKTSSTDPYLAIGSTDLLFIDSDHSYEHVLQELEMHAKNVQRWIVLHDSVSCPGVSRAIEDFLEKGNHHYWEIAYHCPLNHGLTILQRI